MRDLGHIVHLHAHELTHGAGIPVLIPRTNEEVGALLSELLQVSVLDCLCGVLWDVGVRGGRSRLGLAPYAAEQTTIPFPGILTPFYHYNTAENKSPNT